MIEPYLQCTSGGGIHDRRPTIRQTASARDEVFREFETNATEAHFGRVRAGRKDSVKAGRLHLDIVRDLKRVNSHLAAAAYPILEGQGELLPSRLKQDG
jgi:phosphate:Na+ symporter